MLIFKEGATTIKVIDKPESESELEKDMIDWNIQTQRQKMRSDDKSIELFGKTNQQMYELYKGEFLKKTTNKKYIIYDGTDVVKEYVDFEKFRKDRESTEYAIVRCKKYSNNENITVLYPTSDLSELETLMSNWDSMPQGQKLRSDDYCKEIWGVTNQDMYDACIALIDKIENGEDDPLLSISRDKRIDGYDDKKFDAAHTIKLEDFCGPVGYYVVPVTENTPIQINREETLQKLLYAYDRAKDEDKPVLEQNILNLGWIPGIPYNSNTRMRAGLLESKIKYTIVDKTKEIVSKVEEDTSEMLKPVYIVLVEGTSLFSHAIKAFTEGPFSHAAICIDETFQKMYSFNIQHGEGKGGSGLSIESVTGYPKDSKLGVFAIFVKEKDYHTIETLLEMYDKNKKDTSYSFLNIVALPFNKSIKMDFNMICSEFVDNILKLTNIEIVDKESPLVTPNDFYRASQKNKKIFKLYEGKVKNFLPKTIKSRVSKVKKEYIKEYALIEAEFPVQFTDDGDLTIKNMKKIDYDEEIAKSNRLLKIYYKEDNREGTKYELAKLWFIMNLIISDIDKGKGDKKELTKSKAICMNVISNYLKHLLKKEEDFNLVQYYESTPFGDATIKIKGSTIKYTVKLLKDIILS